MCCGSPAASAEHYALRMPTVASDARLSAHVDRIEQEHPPVPLDSVDYTVHRPELLEERSGHVLDYLARVEQEVERNVLELPALLPDGHVVDRQIGGEECRERGGQ